MALKKELLNDLKEAMKSKDEIKKKTITIIRAAILQQEKDNKVELGDEEILPIISKQLKQRKDVLEDFEKAGRDDLIEETKKEMEVLQAYLPQPLSEAELETIVDETLAEVGATSMKDMGKIMKAVMPKVAGKADGGDVNKIVRKKLS